MVQCTRCRRFNHYASECCSSENTMDWTQTCELWRRGRTSNVSLAEARSIVSTKKYYAGAVTGALSTAATIPHPIRFQLCNLRMVCPPLSLCLLTPPPVVPTMASSLLLTAVETFFVSQFSWLVVYFHLFFQMPWGVSVFWQMFPSSSMWNHSQLHRSTEKWYLCPASMGTKPCWYFGNNAANRAAKTVERFRRFLHQLKEQFCSELIQFSHNSMACGQCPHLCICKVCLFFCHFPNQVI